MFRGSTLVFDKLLEKATSSLRLDPDWPSIMQICDLIRQNDCTPRYAVTAIKKKLNSQNPHQAMFGVLVLESVVKNCGSGVHDEIAAKPNCEVFRDFIKSTPHETVRNKMLELIQAWAFAFRNKSKYRAVQDTVNIMKTEGYKFPALKESDAMFSADTAPDWSDGNVCHRCRVAFTMMQRKHHCRACGQVFCGQCSSKTTTLPKFGIEKEVRVCDACFDLENRPPGPKSSTDTSEAAEFTASSAPGSQNLPRKTAEELQEEEELQLAIALSQSEAEQKEKDKERKRISTSAPPVRVATPPTPPVSSAPPQSQSVELSRYLDRDYWERRASSAAPTNNTATSLDNSKVTRAISPPVKTNISIAPMINVSQMNNKMPVLQLDDNCADVELEEFVAALKSQVEIFVNRMKSNSSRGRSIANDTSVQTLFMNITAMHSRLLRYIQQQDDARVHYEGLQDKLSQVRDSRAALDVLREEHAERMRRAAEAAERQRQMQMAYKLDVMRKKKHEYLQYQRQLALQRIQEQERELQMRQEQQKHQYMMGANAPYFPQNSPVRQFHPVQPGYPAPQFPGQPFPPQQMIPSSGTDGAMGPQSLPNQQNPGMPMMGPHLQGMPVSAGQMVPGMMLGSNTLPRSMPPNTQMPPMNAALRHPSPQMMNQPGQPMIRPPTSQPHQLPPHQIPPHQIPQQQMPPQQLQRQMPPQQMPPQQMPPQQMPPQQIPPQQMPQQHMPPQQQQQGIPMQHKMPQMMQQHPQQQMHGGPPQMPPMQQPPANPPVQDTNPPPPQITQTEPAPPLPNSPPANQTAELISFD